MLIILPFIEFKAGTLMPIIIGGDALLAVLSLFNIRLTNIDHFGHLGGALFGAVMYYVLINPRQQQRKVGGRK